MTVSASMRARSPRATRPLTPDEEVLPDTGLPTTIRPPRIRVEEAEAERRKPGVAEGGNPFPWDTSEETMPEITAAVLAGWGQLGADRGEGKGTG